MTRLAPAAAFVLILWLVPVRVSAQTGQGRRAGRVPARPHAVLPGVSVIAASPSLIGDQPTITRADGRYLFPALPPGLYTITFTLASFQTVRREGIDLPLATTITVDAEMTLSSLQETVVVTGASPMVDGSTPEVGVNLKDAHLVGVPNWRDIWVGLWGSPGIRMQGFDGAGSHKSQQSGFEVFGIQNQIRVISDGI